jgi:hypothetical protein
MQLTQTRLTENLRRPSPRLGKLRTALVCRAVPLDRIPFLIFMSRANREIV